MRNNGYLLKLFAALAILMLAVNAAVLHFGFGIHISDLADFIAHFDWDGPGKSGDSSQEMPVHESNGDDRPGDGLAEGSDGQAGVGDSSAKERITERDGSVETGDGSPVEEARDDSPEIQADILEVIKNISIGDKIFLYRIFAKIGGSGLDEILNMVQDGITADEIDRIKSYVSSFLKPADAARLEEMFARYGHIYAEAGK